MLIPPTTQIPVIAPMPTIPAATASDSSKKSRQHDQHDAQDDSSGRGNTRDTAGARSGQALSHEEQSDVQRLAQRDREVRAHEAAHKAVAGRYARGGADYEYERGPDGQQYAVGGEVSIDISRPDNPEAALQKALLIQRAAMAPAQPSAQDRAVANEAAQMAAEARAEIRAQKAEKTQYADGSARQLAEAYRAETDAASPRIDLTV